MIVLVTFCRLTGKVTNMATSATTTNDTGVSVGPERVRRFVWWRFLLRLIFGLAAGVVALVIGVVLWIVYWPLPSLTHSSLLQPPGNVRSVAGHGTLTLTWDAVPGAIGYQVLRSERKTRDYIVAGAPYGYHAGPLQFPLFWDRLITRILPGHFGRLAGPQFVDTALQPGHTYFYRVQASDGAAWTELTPPLASTAQSDAGTTPLVSLVVNSAQNDGTIPHVWEKSIGSERLSYMLLGDINANLTNAGAKLRQANKMAHDELGIQYVVTHSILNDDMKMYREDAAGVAQYDFSTLDRLYDMVLADGLKPYVQLDFMPQQLASDPRAMKSIFTHSTYEANDTPPKDYAKWGALINAFATHLVQRYGKAQVESWPFAVWNEPDVCFWFWPACYWKGNADQYYHLYDYAAVALRGVDPKIRVGGPVTLTSAFVEPFLRHVTSHNYATQGSSVPLDFLDVRIYMEDPYSWTPLLTRYGLGKLPVYYSEWGVREILGDPVNDMPYGAAWIASSLQRSAGNADAVSYWTSSDYFDEHGEPQALFHGGFGLMGLENLRKPRYWAYYLLHQLGTSRIKLSGQGDGFDTLVNGWATRNDDESVRILLSNVTNDQTSARGNPALNRDVRLSVAGLQPGTTYRLQHYRIDETHSNVFGSWQKMGAPVWPTSTQLAELHQLDGLQTLKPESLVPADAQGNISVEFQMPMPSLTFLTLTPANRGAK